MTGQDEQKRGALDDARERFIAWMRDGYKWKCCGGPHTSFEGNPHGHAASCPFKPIHNLIEPLSVFPPQSLAEQPQRCPTCGSSDSNEPRILGDHGTSKCGFDCPDPFHKPLNQPTSKPGES